ncbi:uncharacterized protein LOC131148088 [Malania oleifera]|uniref:uncharacterized protein LOC131148088 n=1 Tax=Malania oleifera TaxID=397392 RepID=UPI0025AE49F3|nr:uncharacterized protein LOC131148088 [Malania oleifera]
MERKDNNMESGSEEIASDESPSMPQGLMRFTRMHPPMFVKGPDPIIAEDWVEKTERILEVLHCTDEQRVLYFTFQLSGEAGRWWTAVNLLENQRADVLKMSWSHCKELLLSDLTDDLQLTWVAPSCGRCEAIKISLSLTATAELQLNSSSSNRIISGAAVVQRYCVLQASSMVETAANTSNTETSSSLQDSYNIGDPLFLHPSENPGAILTSQPLIGEENYPAWARSVKKSLIAKNKLGFIDGSLTISSPLVNSPNAIQAWVCADNMVSTWIINSVSPKLQGSIIYRDIALEIWIDLRDTFSQGNGTKIFNIQKQIAEIHQGEMSLTEYFTQLKILWDQLQNLNPFPQCTCGQCVCGINQNLQNLQAKESTMKFLMGVNDIFSQVRTQILLMDPLPSVNKVHSLFIQEEMQRSVHNVVRVESTALATKNFGTNFKGKERPLCTHCGKLGHTIDKCYKLHGFPPGFKFKNNKYATAHQVSSNIDFVQRNNSNGFNDSASSQSVSQAPAFTHDQYQQLLTLIGSCSSSQLPKNSEFHAANAVTGPSNVVAGNCKHSVFSAKAVNRKAYDLHGLLTLVQVII